MTSSFQVFLAVAAFMALGYYFFLDLLVERVERQYLEAAEEPMIDTANLLAAVAGHHLENGGFSDLESALTAGSNRQISALIYNVLKTDIAMGAYLTDADGIVILDTHPTSAVGEDFSSYRDVALTLHGLYGARSSRKEESDDRSSVMFVGAPVIDRDGSIVGCLSISKPQASMFAFMDETRHFIYRAGWIAFCATLAGVAFALYWFSRPILRLTEYARAVRRGERPTLRRSRNPEVATLGRALEEMRGALEDRKYVENYVQTLTHEMKSPVAAIRGAAELLGDSPQMPPPQRERFLANIQSESRRLELSVERLLALSAIEGRTALDASSRVDLSALTHEILDTFSPAFDAAALVCRAAIATGITVRGDEYILRTAITNLLQNAIDFSPASSAISVALTQTDGSAILKIADVGAGIPDYAVGRVFDRFYSLTHPSTGRKSSGLGLCFVKEAAQLHDGTATLTNNSPAPGATATLALPIPVSS